MEYVKLSDVAIKMNRGLDNSLYRYDAERDKDIEPTEVEIINFNQISRFGVDLTKCKKMLLKKKTLDKFYVPTESHILLLSRINAYDVAYMYYHGNPVMHNNNTVMIVVDNEKINPVYLQAYMNSPIGRANRAKQIYKSVPTQLLAQLLIPYPDRETQDKIADEYNNVVYAMKQQLKYEQEFYGCIPTDGIIHEMDEYDDSYKKHRKQKDEITE